MIRLLGLVELGIGLGCVAMRLVSREKPAVPADQEIILPATQVAKEAV